MTTVVDQVITVFDAVWKGQGAAKSAAASLQQYQKVSAKTAIDHQKLAYGADNLKRGMMSLGSEVAKGTMSAEAAQGAFVKMGKELATNEAAMEKLSVTTQTTGERFKGFVGDIGLGVVALGAITMALKGTYAAVKTVYDAGKEGANLLQLRDSFDTLNSSVMMTPGLLDDMVTASRNTISEAAAMEGVMTLVAGMSQTMARSFADAAPELMNIAKAANKLNPTLGDTAFMFNSIARGIKRQEPRLLDNLGLNIKVAAASAAYSKEMGIAVTAMTAEDKQQALLNETLRVGKLLIDQVGGSTESAADGYLMLSAATEDYKNAMKESIAMMSLGGVGTFGSWMTMQADIAQLGSAETAAVRAGITTREELNQLYTGKDPHRWYIERAEILERIIRGYEGMKQSGRGFNRRDEADNPPDFTGEDFMKQGDNWRKEIRIWAGATTEAGAAAVELTKDFEGLIITQDALDARNKNNVETAKEMIKEIDALTKQIRELDAATGDYAIAAIGADKESSLFNQSISDIGESWVTVGGRTKEQNELLSDLRSAYDKAGESARDYETGIKGFSMTQDKVNEKMREGAAAQTYYSQQIADLEAIRGKQQRTTTEATWNQENINKAVVEAADAAGASATEIVGFMVATGQLTEAQAEATLESVRMQEAIKEFGKQIDESTSPEKVIANIEAIKTAILGLSFDELMRGDSDPRKNPFLNPEWMDGDPIVPEVRPLYQPTAKSDMERAQEALDEIKEGAEAVIAVDGLAARGELDGLLSRLRDISKTWTVKIDINQNGNVPKQPGGEPAQEAFGGPITSGGTYWVGERGPELFVPSSNGRIIPTGQSGGGDTININNYNRAAAAVAMTMLDMQRRTGARL